MRTIKYFSTILLLLTLHISCSTDDNLKYESPKRANEFTNFTFNNTNQTIDSEITITIESGDYQSTEVHFVDEIGVPYTPPKTEPSEGETIDDLDNVLIPTITATENNNLEYKIEVHKLRPEDQAFSTIEDFLVEIKVVTNNGTELTGYRRIYFNDIEYTIDNEYLFIGDGANIEFTPLKYTEIEITLMDEAGVPSVIDENEIVTINEIDDTNFTISATEPTEQLIEVKLTNENGDEFTSNHLIHFYAHGTVDYYKTVEGIELGVDTTEKLTLIHGAPVEEDKLTSEDGLTERWQYLSDGIGFEVNAQTQIIEKVYYYSTSYEDYPAGSPYVIEEDLKYKMGVMKAKHPKNGIDADPTENGTIKEATSDGDGGFNVDGVYYFDFENIGRFIYISDSKDNVNTAFVVQVIIG
ncbi:hypothetical protein [Wenyingzhuangia sp. 2_MG-2023]|uniref:hypothetical protein n=1 Tax=Wenyingzhuangia sp. 2_MG-2023 TaxID=3062639 RepID=UPI0026E469FA|nr:hypothetical protein [Wenyingzhuangia sp. 2_MG-2023]MDO6737712.1 hypothetical protein [Wenyingzhuangia sp. 2_MG-2023]MDO6802551.1 hypothetical protein [Wenyingzhuangia sp. 1_MG-2023]